MNKVTIKDIAKLAGVSIGTVDRVLHNRGRVSDDTKTRILSIIEETGFTLDFMASRLKQKNNVTYGVIMPNLDQDSGYWQLCYNGFKEAEKDLNPLGVSVKFFHFNRFDEVNIQDTLNLASELNLSGYILAPVRPSLFKSAIREGKLGRNIILFDSNLPGIEQEIELETFCYIGLDDYQSGKLAGRLLHLLIDEKAHVIVVDISEKDNHLKERINGFCQFFTKNPDKRVFSVIGSDTDNLKDAQLLIEPFFRNPSHEQPGLFVPNATTHLYVSACEALGYKEIKVVGYDVVESNKQMLKDGRIEFILSQRPAVQAIFALQNMHRSQGLKQHIDDKVLLPVDIITKENLH
ncbi:LacI family DNA-binding transcriptional regulator [Spirochaeta cellobiosiphila]|uniref:LacI family DNA-binding transcriptional regulator n=1 Tax=Spirochaeta cellobiosiphila TaxID=504483 RepID=UPI0003F8DF63|nr:LacI family DNA-binding transcriptional regulator [Spirochaeta cellobiosiphila]